MCQVYELVAELCVRFHYFVILHVLCVRLVYFGVAIIGSLETEAIAE